MPIVTINDYTTMPSRSARHPFTRQCPNLRTCWPGLSATFNPNVPSRSLMYRRIAFLATLSLRLLHNLLNTYYLSAVGYGLPSIIFSILFFFVMAWNLHLIVNMTGERVVFNRTFDRDSFDVALWTFTACHCLLFIGDMWMRGMLGGVPNYFLWGCVDLAIFGTAWVATWTGDGELSLP